MQKTEIAYIQEIAKRIRALILRGTTQAGSGHPTSCLSSVELMATLFFGGASAGGYFHADVLNPKNPNNDRVIFSKGHAAPLLYALYVVAGVLKEDEFMNLRTLESVLEGHPTMRFPYTEAATGSLGQGLSIGVGIALALRRKNLKKLPKVFVLLGDGEMAEGANWEAIQLASFYRLNNLVGIIDVSCLEQIGESMTCRSRSEHGAHAFEAQLQAFGWDTIIVDGHDIASIASAYEKAMSPREKPFMIIAVTIKGKGISFLEGNPAWHGKALSHDELDKALEELGTINESIRGRIAQPEEKEELKKEKISDNAILNEKQIVNVTFPDYKKGEMIATRRGCCEGLVYAYKEFPDIVVIDAGVANSTNTYLFQQAHKDAFYEAYIAEQNMVGMAVGFSRMGYIPFVSSFGAFLMRAADQFRMSQYSDANIKVIGSHAGVAIGPDGPSQMALEDISFFRSLLKSVVLYPSDAICAAKIIKEAVRINGIVYIRTTRNVTPVIYHPNDEFPVGGSKTLFSSDKDVATIVGAGVTLHEAIKAHAELEKQNIPVRVIDLYSIKPVDIVTLEKAVHETKKILVVEDHYPAGGIAEAVRSALSEIDVRVPVYSLAVRKIPRSGSERALLEFEEISASSILQKIKEITSAS